MITLGRLFVQALFIIYAILKSMEIGSRILLSRHSYVYKV